MEELKKSKQIVFAMSMRTLHVMKISLLLICLSLPALKAENGGLPGKESGAGWNVSAVQQQRKQLAGKVLDANGDPIIGANILEEGTMNGTVTDVDGNFTLNLSNGNATIHISYIGYIEQKINVAGRSSLVVTLVEDTQSLEELVVIGYGVQKKKLLTGATVQVSGDELTKLSTTSALAALQSQTPGVNIIQNNGQPGEGFKVSVRGLGTIGNSSPLYVIDGVAGGDINSLNPADIESVDVLKDAASAAIYGARAANGVVLVTTKQGKKGKTIVNYDNYYGHQYISKMPGLLNAKEYMEIQDLRYKNDGHASGYDWAGTLPDYLYKSIMDGTWKGTDWVKEAYKKGAPTQNHAVNVTGGSDLSKFSVGFSYTGQEGILGWNKIDPVNANYKRYTGRINSDHVVLKAKEHNLLTVGETLKFSLSRNNGIQQDDIYWNDLHNYLVASPLLPVYTYDEKGKIEGWYDQNAKTREGWTFSPKEVNPLALSALSSRGKNESKDFSLQASAYVLFEPIKDLVFKSQFGFKYSADSYRSYTSEYYLSTQTEKPMDEVSQSASLGYSWTLDNTLSYRFSIDNHLFDAVIGQSAEKWGFGESVGSGSQKTIYSGAGFKYAWVSNGKPTELSQVSYSGSPWGEGAIASFFGRLNYNYLEKYLATFTLRADGSTNFARNHRWGYFPSISGGWVLSEEDFLADFELLDFMKLRLSWGQNGNCNIDNFQYLTSFSFSSSNGYAFDKGKNIMSTGATANVLANPNVSWETSEQTNIGVDLRFINNKLGVVVDWYNKMTKDWLVQAPIAAVYGFNAPYINGGDVKNTGVELALNWNDRRNDFSYDANFNISYNRNKVTKIANEEGIIHGPEDAISEGTGEYYRVEVGRPIGFFWGYKTAGIFQNEQQIAATKAKLEGAQPGDVIFVDVNGDGQITEDDRTMIGNPHPDFILGFNFGARYKRFDFNITARGAFGQDIAKSYRSFVDSPLQNYTKDVYNTWMGEGTSNKLPRLTSGSHTNWMMLSDIFLEKGDYVKIANITLGYDFKQLVRKTPFEKLRLFASVNNLYNFTKYSGMDPEVGYGYENSNWMSGIDLGSYPASTTYLMGVNIQF
jgi:TonB-linked SusC/RagA family outer membrane protein